MLNFPPKVKVEEINQMHPWRAGLGPVWENARLLHDGGHRLSNSAGNFIIRRFMEPETIYRERLKHFTSEGILGTSVSFYSEALFEDPLKVALDIENENEKTIFSQLLERAWRDQRRRGSSIQDLALQIPADWLVFCLSWTLIERPPLTAASRSQELNNPSLWPYAVLLEPEDVINWSVGEDDQLDWVVIHSVETEQETPFSKPEKVIRWRVYDRKFAAVYRKSEDNDKKDIAVLEGEPVPHALHDAELVPVVRSEVPKSLWIADRALLSLESGIRASSAVDWAIEQSALAIPVISNDTEVNLTKSETAWIQLEANGSAGYLESSGKGMRRARKTYASTGSLRSARCTCR